MARYLVTGGAGFIGSHLAEVLMESGHSVRILDDFSTGRVENVPKSAELVIGDVTDKDAIGRAFQEIDGCFHLAAIASVQRCTEEWLRSHTVNIGGTIAVFEAARRAQERRGQSVRVVYASSAAVYGEPARIPIAEDATPHPMNAYGIDKLGCEMHAEIARHVHELDAIGLRFFNVYGPRQDPNSPYSGVISIFGRRAAERLPFHIHGNGGQRRDFIFVTDVVSALRGAMEGKGLKHAIFNVCTGIGTQIKTLGQLIADIQGVPFCAAYGPERIADIRSSVGDPTRSRDAFGFIAQTPLRLGLIRTFSASLAVGIVNRVSREELHRAVE